MSFALIFLVLAGQASLLWATKEAKLPARNFSLEGSSLAWLVLFRKIDHAGLKAERKNGGLALPGGNSESHSPPPDRCLKGGVVNS